MPEPVSRPAEDEAAFGVDAVPLLRQEGPGSDPPGPGDWERLIAGGGGPALALGGERRLRREAREGKPERRGRAAEAQ